MRVVTGLPQSDLDRSENFPGFNAAPGFLQDLIIQSDARHILDIGGGAHPILSHEFVESKSLDLSILDISSSELDKAHDAYDKVVADAGADSEVFLGALRGRTFDFVYSHMFLEHVQNPSAVHRNIAQCLNPGGYAVHFFPSKNNIPLFANSVLPERLTLMLTRFAQPERDLGGTQGKFPAFYKMGAVPTLKNVHMLGDLGFEILKYTGYIGHSYYKRLPPLAALERAMRSICLSMNIPLTTFGLLVLRKPTDV